MPHPAMKKAPLTKHKGASILVAGAESNHRGKDRMIGLVAALLTRYHFLIFQRWVTKQLFKEVTMKILTWLVPVLLAAASMQPSLAFAQSAIDGRWQGKDPKDQVTFKVEGDHVTMSASSGSGYKAKLDGTDAPLTGDKAADRVSVTMPDKNTLLETSKKDGVAWLTMRMQVDANGKSAKVTWKNTKNGKSGSYEMVKN